MDIVKNKDYTVKITGITHEGQGVARIEGLAVFVDGALEGETVEIRVIKLNKSYAVGKLIKIIDASEKRTEPYCSVYKRCGGCSLQHMDYGATLEFKTGVVRENLKRIGKLVDIKVHDAIGMEEPFRYRNKAQFPVAMTAGTTKDADNMVNTGSVVTGFYAKRSHDVIDSGDCRIQDEASNKVRQIVKAFIVRHGITVYDETTGKGLVRHVMVRTAFHTGEVMAVIVINGAELPYSEELVKDLTAGTKDSAGIDGIRSVMLNVNREKTNVIMGKKNICLYGREYIEDTIGPYRFRISPLSFFQVNPVQTEVLYKKALEYAGLTGKETVFDLYCGIGTISLFLSQMAAKVYGVEVVEDAVRDAKLNAEINGVSNVEFIVGEAETVIPEMYKQGIKADVVVVDPPRKGCEEALLRTLVEMRPERIVYVSCNPSTLARDLKYLDENGYKAAEAQPVDMFPWTEHVECVIRIQRAK